MNAIKGHDFLCNIDDVQMNQIVDCMYKEVFVKEQIICRENLTGHQLYIISGK